MMHYIRIYRKLLAVNFSALVSSRSNFFSSITGSVVWGVFSIIFIVLLSSRASSVYGWTREELYILTGIYNIIMGVFFFFFSRNFEQFASILHYGKFDSILIKPVDSQFFVSTYFVNYAGLFRIVLGIAFTLYMLNSQQITFGILDVLSFLLFVLVGALAVYALWFLVITLTIWNTMLSNLSEFMYTISGVARYPREMFTAGAREVFFILVLPLTYVVNVPARALLHKVALPDIGIFFLCTAGLLIASRFFWKFAIRSYSSASS